MLALSSGSCAGAEVQQGPLSQSAPAAPSAEVAATPDHEELGETHHPRLAVEAAADGWTQLTPSAETRKVYVSSSKGDDGNDGLSPEKPKRTLAAGKALMRQGFPDWLLLLRGDVWQESLGQWKVSGPATGGTMLISAWGDAPARPLLETGRESGIATYAGGGSAPRIDNLAIVGLHFRAGEYRGVGECVGARMLQPSSHFLIEDCKFEGFGTNLVFQGFGGEHTDFKLRRSVIADSFSVHGNGNHSQGLYAYAVNGLLIEENVFDHNGWSASVPGAGADIYSHNIYIDNGNSGVVVRGNIIANAASHGMQLRPGGEVLNNLFVRNSIALHVGGGNAPDAGGVTAQVLGNVILDGKNIDDANPRGWGLWMGNIASGRVAFNVIAGNSRGVQPAALILDGAHVGEEHASIGVHDLSIERNVLVDWGGGIELFGDDRQLTGIVLERNDVQETRTEQALLLHGDPLNTAGLRSAHNRFYSQRLPADAWMRSGERDLSFTLWSSRVGDATSAGERAVYPDPQRSVASYCRTLGGAESYDAFIEQARAQSREHWRPEYLAAELNRYVRAGFALEFAEATSASSAGRGRSSATHSIDDRSGATALRPSQNVSAGPLSARLARDRRAAARADFLPTPTDTEEIHHEH